MPVRQEVLNVILAELLQERGLVAMPEEIIHNIYGGSRRMPDVIIDFQGLRLAIEGEINRSASASKKATKSAYRRVTEGIAHMGVAVLYPAQLPNIEDLKELKRELESSHLLFSIITETRLVSQLSLFPAQQGKVSFQFVEGDLDGLAESLRRAYEQLVEDEVLERAVAILGSSIELFISYLVYQPATTQRFADALGIRELS